MGAGCFFRSLRRATGGRVASPRHTPAPGCRRGALSRRARSRLRRRGPPRHGRVPASRGRRWRARIEGVGGACCKCLAMPTASPPALGARGERARGRGLSRRYVSGSRGCVPGSRSAVLRPRVSGVTRERAQPSGHMSAPRVRTGARALRCIVRRTADRRERLAARAEPAPPEHAQGVESPCVETVSTRAAPVSAWMRRIEAVSRVVHGRAAWHAGCFARMELKSLPASTRRGAA